MMRDHHPIPQRSRAAGDTAAPISLIAGINTCRNGEPTPRSCIGRSGAEALRARAAPPALIKKRRASARLAGWRAYREYARLVAEARRTSSARDDEVGGVAGWRGRLVQPDGR